MIPGINAPAHANEGRQRSETAGLGKLAGRMTEGHSGPFQELSSALGLVALVKCFPQYAMSRTVLYGWVLCISGSADLMCGSDYYAWASKY